MVRMRVEASANTSTVATIMTVDWCVPLFFAVAIAEMTATPTPCAVMLPLPSTVATLSLLLMKLVGWLYASIRLSEPDSSVIVYPVRFIVSLVIKTVLG